MELMNLYLRILYLGMDNLSVFATDSKWYILTNTEGDFLPTFMYYDIWKKHLHSDCTTCSNDEKLTFTNRYSKRKWTQAVEGEYSSPNDTYLSKYYLYNKQILQQFTDNIKTIKYTLIKLELYSIYNSGTLN